MRSVSLAHLPESFDDSSVCTAAKISSDERDEQKSCRAGSRLPWSSRPNRSAGGSLPYGTVRGKKENKGTTNRSNRHEKGSGQLFALFVRIPHWPFRFPFSAFRLSFPSDGGICYALGRIRSA